jgi:hypothetical protein
MDNARLIPRKRYFEIAPADYLKTAPSPDAFILAIPSYCLLKGVFSR